MSHHRSRSTRPEDYMSHRRSRSTRPEEYTSRAPPPRTSATPAPSSYRSHTPRPSLNREDTAKMMSSSKSSSKMSSKSSSKHSSSHSSSKHVSSSSSSRKKMAASAASVAYFNAVYFPNSKIYSGATPGMLNYGCINRVYYAYASISLDGSVFLSDEWADVKAPCDGVQGGLGSLMHLRQAHPHLQVVLSIGGGDSSQVFPVVAADPMRRDNFGRSARALVDASGLDGIDICWEWPRDVQQGGNYTSLLATMRMHLPEEYFILTSQLPASRTVLSNLDIRSACSYLDSVNLVAYDLCGPWSSRSGHHAALYSAHKDGSSGSVGAAMLIASGCPTKKIIFGVPAYGRSFLGVSGPGHRPKGFGGADGMGVVDYCELPPRGAKEIFDKGIGAAGCVGGDAGGFISYDTPETVKMKATFVRQKQLGGLFYSSAPSDHRDKTRSLISAGFRSLHSS